MNILIHTDGERIGNLTMESMVVNESSKRIQYIDFLKFIGLTGIICAHVGSPGWVMMLRSFDVPFMVILSSILANKSFSKFGRTNSEILKYYVSRAKRLVFPTWIFLFLYFILLYIVSGKRESLSYYVASFGLTRYGIGYVWIILIYLYSALLVPLLSKIKFSIKSIIFVFVIYLIYEIAYYYKLGLNGGVISAIIETSFYYFIPYGVLTYLGYNYNFMNKRIKITVASISLFIFLALAIYYFINSGSLQLVSIVKYPPRLYYLSYGIACSFALLYLCENHNCRIFENRIIKFISSHSMWVYLWHILVLAIYEKFRLPEIWYVKLLLVYTFSIIIVLIANKLLDLIEKKVKLSIFKYLRG